MMISSRFFVASTISVVFISSAGVQSSCYLFFLSISHIMTECSAPLQGPCVACGFGPRAWEPRWHPIDRHCHLVLICYCFYLKAKENIKSVHIGAKSNCTLGVGKLALVKTWALQKAEIGLEKSVVPRLTNSKLIGLTIAN